MRTMTDIQATKIHSYGQGKAFFHPARDSLHGTPHGLAQNWEDGCRVGNDTSIIRLPRPVLAGIPVPRWAGCVHKSQ
jgi:hypothetical protein